MTEIKLGFALCGSFCNFENAIAELEKLRESGDYTLFPIFSNNAYETDTRFGKAADFVVKVEAICGRRAIHTIAGAEPLGPKRMIDALLILPVTGSTLAKLALGITDTPVAMAAKSSLRAQIPVILGIATNDALAASAQNIGRLLNTRQIYFIPFSQDAPAEKPRSAVCRFEKTRETLKEALAGRQIQPILF